MIIRKRVSLSGMMDSIVSDILSNSNWVQVSSNTTMDYVGASAGSSDGYIFKSPAIGGGRCVYLRMKTLFDYSNPSNCSHARILFQICDSYTPNPTPGLNGTISPAELRTGTTYYHNYLDISTPFGSTTEIGLQYILIIDDHRIVFCMYPDTNLSSAKMGWMYAGYPDLKSSFSNPDKLDNVFLFISDGAMGNYTNGVNCGLNVKNELGTCYYSNSGYDSLITTYLPTYSTSFSDNQYLFEVSPVWITPSTYRRGFPAYGALDGLYAIGSNSYINNGDIIKTPENEEFLYVLCTGGLINVGGLVVKIK